MVKKDEFITADEDVITPERLAKGDIFVGKNAKGKISTAAVIDNSIIKALIDRNSLQSHHEIYGLGFLELQAAFRAPWMVKSCAVLLAQWGVGISGSRATEIYQNVCRGMRGRGIEVVQHAMNERADIIVRYPVGLYQEHFDRLVSLMDEERERILNEAQNKI